MSCDKLETFHLYFDKVWKRQTWYGGGLGWISPTYQVTCPFDHVVLRCHVTKYKRYISFYKTFNNQTWYSGYFGEGHMTTKLSRVEVLGWGLPATKLYYHLITRSCSKWKIQIFFIQNSGTNKRFRGETYSKHDVTKFC